MVVGATLVTGMLLALRQGSPGADIALLNTPAWQGGIPQYGEQLMLRREAEGQRALLLKHSGRETAYRYDPRTRNLTSVTEQEWSRAGGPIAECGKQFPPPRQVLRIDERSRKLMAGPREIFTAGSTVLKMTVSPGDHFVAVLSAAGQMRPSLLPFLGGGGAAGPHFHQTVSLPDAVVIGKTLRIPVQRDNDVLGSCWSADEEMIVYYDILFAYLSVLEANL
jgi:hypothetical protein